MGCMDFLLRAENSGSRHRCKKSDVTILSFANFRSSYKRIEGISYLISPGEWICTLSELSEWFRVRFQHQAVSILDAEPLHFQTWLIQAPG